MEWTFCMIGHDWLLDLGNVALAQSFVFRLALWDKTLTTEHCLDSSSTQYFQIVYNFVQVLLLIVIFRTMFRAMFRDSLNHCFQYLHNDHIPPVPKRHFESSLKFSMARLHVILPQRPFHREASCFIYQSRSHCSSPLIMVMLELMHLISLIVQGFSPKLWACYLLT